jgi:hypothetical protein
MGNPDLDEQQVREWADFIKNFKEVIYPDVFEPQGISLGDAMIIFELNSLSNSFDTLNDTLTEEFDDEFNN